MGTSWYRPTEPFGALFSAATAVVRQGSGFLAVGLDGTDGAAAWTSPDGRTWTPLASESFAGATMADVTAFRGGYVAGGRVIDSPDADAAAAWTSPDGSTWERVPAGGEFDHGQLISLAVGGDRIVAAGGIPGADRAAVWTSSDGTEWERVDPDPSFERAFLWTVTPGGPGFVAGGWRRDPEPAATVWISPDGSSWTRAAPLPGRAGNEVRVIVATPYGLIAAGGSVQGGDAVAWRSADGITWELATSPSFGGASITDLVVVGERVFAIGSRAPDDAGVWVTDDGVSWESLDDASFADGHMLSGTSDADGTQLVIVGAAQRRIPGTGSYDQWATAWLSPAR